MNVNERWDHRADLAEEAITDRHASRLWGLPGTNLGLIAWPPTTRDKFFIRWHYWWQAHYLDNLVDAALRRPSRARLRTIRATARTMRIRNFGKLTRNHYYDDKAWLALALQRAERLPKVGPFGAVEALRDNIFEGIDSLTGVLPWRDQETFYNTPTNGPAAILAVRSGDLALAEQLIEWTFANLINEDGLVMDGLRMRMHGPETVSKVYTYCQGVMLGACCEMAIAQREAADIAPDDISDVGMDSITRVHQLVRAIDTHMTTPSGVLSWPSGGGDGGLFHGILARYLALVATSLPDSGHHAAEARATARRIVLASADSAWRYRLEVDGLPVFPVQWTEDATLPQAGGLVGATIAGSVAASDIAERDLSVQLSGWMLMEAAHAVSR